MKRFHALLACAALSSSLVANVAAAGRGGAAPATRPTRIDPGAGFFPQFSLFAQRQKIKHVVVVMQENRSFDNLFQGFPGANTVSSGLNSKGQTIPLQPVRLETPWNIDHEAETFFEACDGRGRIPGTKCKMDGFDKETTYGKGRPANLAYSYVPHRETKPYFDIGKQYVVGDNMFTSNIDESFESHQYIIAAQANHAVDQPNANGGLRPSLSDGAHIAE